MDGEVPDRGIGEESGAFASLSLFFMLPLLGETDH